MRVRRAVVVLALVVLRSPAVRMEDRSVVVLVDVIVAAMLELAERTTGVMVRYMVVIVGVHDAGMGMLVLNVTGDALHGLGLSHRPVPPGKSSGRGRRVMDVPPRLGLTLSRSDSTALPRRPIAPFKALAVASRPGRTIGIGATEYRVHAFAGGSHGRCTPSSASIADPFAALSASARARLRRTAVPDWISPMLATLTDRRFSDPDWLFERKLDGERCLAFARAGRVTLKSRNANVISDAYPEVVSALEGRRRADHFVADGEIVAFVGRQTSFQQLQRRIHLRAPERVAAAAVPVFFYLFDLLHLDGFDLADLELRERKRLLRRAFQFGGPLRFSTHRIGEGERLYLDACRRGWEGVIAKNGQSPYVHGRSGDWLKFKCSLGQELVIGGFTKPKGSRIGFGALLVGYHEDGRLEYAGKVGTGFDTVTLHDLHGRLRELETEASPFAASGAARRDVAGAAVHWVRPQLVAQIAFSEWTADGRLRHPRYEGLRTDKDPREIVRERAIR
jgi:DNA ligase D-like protein (predicted ligase)